MPDKVVIVTGAGSGIGKAVARAFLREGDRVVLAGRRPAPLEAVIAEARVPAARALAVPTDVTDEAAVRALFDRARDTFGRVDVLFNNAGIGGGSGVPLEDLSADVWRSVVETNLTGPFLCTREAFRVMKSQAPRGGRIINNGSISAHVPRPSSVAYVATKHAITGLTKATSLDGRRHDIACGQIDIGNALTEANAKLGEGNPVPQADGRLAVEPVMDVEHVARAVLYMAGLPLEANVQFMTVLATKMPYIGRG